MRVLVGGNDTHGKAASARRPERIGQQSAVAGSSGQEGVIESAAAAVVPPRWALFHTNRAAWAAAKEMLKAARETIAIEQYIFSYQGIGREILDILTDKTRHGVRVRLVADAFGSRNLLKSEGARYLLRAGGEIAIFNGVAEFFRNPASAFHRLHRKSIVCDSQWLMTGGSCFHPRMEDWRDTMVLIEGPVARKALEEFETTWLRANKLDAEPPDPSHSAPEEKDGDWSYMVSSPYGPGKREYYLELIERIAQAERIVTLTSPYLVPVGRFWTTMERATRRGVRVRVMIPSKSDQPLIDLFSLRFARDLLGRGIEVYGYKLGMMHAKLAIVDDDWAAVGSFNLGIDSIKMNLEGVLVSRSRAFHDALAEQLEADLASSRRL